MKTCGTCRHWGVDLRNSRQDTLAGWVDQKRCYRIADSSEHVFDNEHVLDDEPAYTQDGSGYFSALLTKPDFGCVLWEPKND